MFPKADNYRPIIVRQADNNRPIGGRGGFEPPTFVCKQSCKQRARGSVRKRIAGGLSYEMMFLVFQRLEEQRGKFQWLELFGGASGILPSPKASEDRLHALR